MMTRAEAASWLDAHAVASKHVIASSDAELMAINLRTGADVWAMRAWARADLRRLRRLREILGEEAFAARVFTPAIVLRVEVAEAAAVERTR